MSQSTAERPTPATVGRLLATVCLLAPLAPVRADGPPGPGPGPTAEARLTDAAFEAHNRIRAENDLPPLTRSPLLEAAATGHAREMADRQVMTHEGADGSTATNRVDRQDYPYRNVGENVAYGQTSAEQVMQGWMDSAGHKANILGDYTQIGLAVARSRDGTPYWCVNFATPWPKQDPAAARAEVVAAINREREKQNLPAVREDPRLSRLADIRASALLAHKPDDETPRSGDEFTAQLRKTGYRFREVAELAAIGRPGPREFVQSLADDPSQRKGLLGGYRDVGVGLATGDHGTPCWDLILAAPLGRR